MHLRYVEVLGYKSFAEKTRIDLEPGINGIVGPNGCGKSNIIDAIRWCLGEMSWKQLRAGSMMDVIFAGSSQRPHLGMCEVTLVFDNAESLLPVQYSEVTVTRRIYRSGESEYYLNKIPCRLRDIRELFLDTGLGGEGYAIIDQGGVEFVLRARPEERRALFEEAAGVAKFKAKREEALRKLERVEVDLGRLKDSLALINEQVRKLDSEARRAKLYKKYQEELKALEVASLLSQVDALGRDLGALRERARPLEEAFGAKGVALDAEGANLAALNLERAGQQGQASECNQRLAHTRAEIARLEERAAAAKEALEDALARRRVCAEEIASARKRLAVYGPELDSAREALAGAEAGLAAAQQGAGESRARIDSLSAAQAALEEGLRDLAARKLQAKQETLDGRRALAQRESARANQEGRLRGSLRALERDLARAEAAGRESDAAVAEQAAQQPRTDAARRLAAESSGRLEEIRRLVRAAGEDFAKAGAELISQRARIEALEAEGGRNPYWTGARAVVAAGFEGVLGTVADLIRVEDSAKPLVEDALGERLHAVVCENSEAARAAIEFLGDSGKGRARFLILSSLPSAGALRAYPPESRPLLDRLRFDARHEPAIRFLFEESYTLGPVLYGDHWVFGGSSEGGDASRPRLADLAQSREALAAMESREGLSRAALASAEEDAAAAEKSHQEAQAAFGGALARERELAERAARSAEFARRIRDDAEGSRGEAAGLLAELSGSLEGALQLLDRTSQAEAAETAIAAREEALRTESDGMVADLARENAALGSLDQRLGHLQENIDSRRADISRREADAAGLRDDIARREAESSALEERRAQAERTRAQALEEISGHAANLEPLSQAAASAHGRLIELDVAVAEKTEALRVLREEHGGVQKNLHQIEIEASGLRSRQDVLKSRLWEEWRLAEEEARSQSAGAAADPERIESLRKRLANMGNINLAAPEDYEALSQRSAFLDSQITDLQKAKDDLHSAIQKINSTTRENFRLTFSEVREHFRRLYGVLFEGGEADLVLTDQDDLLETGVDIVAQPPGKRLQHLSLLSGGEKTLTAIALLFAFFMVKPSPFCLLDEADAALDDANIERFVALLREFQARTQFLIVSHNKRTVEAAERIYGVTMAEAGVSQILSVDFKKRSSAAGQPSAGEPSAAAGNPA